MAITQMLPSIWSARILEKLEKSLVYAQPGTVRRDFEGEIRADGDRVHFHSFADLTIGTYVKDSTTLTYENLTDARVTLLVDQAKYFAFRVDDINAAQMRPKIIDAAADRASYQLAQVADAYVASLYAGASSSNPDNIVEATQATAANVYSKFVGLAQRMDENNLPAEGRYCIIPPWVLALLRQDSTFVTQASPATVLNGSVGMIAGINLLVSNNVPATGTPTDDYHCAAGVANAIGYAEQIVLVEGLRLEGSFSDGIRGLHLYGAKVLQPELLYDLQLSVA
jgi:N4-gp56 family major capsid protein